MKKDTVVILNFGGQYSQLIARRIRESNVYCEILPYNTGLNNILEKEPKGIIFTGGPASILDEKAPKCDPAIFDTGIPILGICYGMQFMAVALGGTVGKASQREYGKVEIALETNNELFYSINHETNCWMSHTFNVDQLPSGFEVIARTKNCPVAAMADKKKKLYAVQFHPEVVHTPRGIEMLHNFLFRICGCQADWKMCSFVESTIESIKNRVGNKKVLCGLSGGVDSSVAAALVNRAVGEQLTCIFVDHGLMRKNEGDEVEAFFSGYFHCNFIRVNARERFLKRLAGITDPEQKRKIVGEEFIRVFEEEAKKIGKVDFLVQGTIYPDVIESGSGDASLIKSHHNVGGLPDYIDFQEIIEPLRDLFKDEVRKAGLELGLPEHLVWRQPFPGPGLSVRIIGEITEERLELLRETDFILRDEIAQAGLEKTLDQYFTVLTDMRSVGVMGDERTYDYTVAIRAVTTTDFMTADWARIPLEVLGRISNRIVNEVKHVNRVVYDITSKPPATIEWE
ncbi:MAG: glutamine-hydrolyzing GMP synthase [Clostridiaceae bacterium]|nr:glutamine-hydrolyzing GMP synthase [Clostridiaceae bacterium]